MNINSETWRHIGVATAAVTALLIFGFGKGFGLSLDTNLFNTGVPMFAIVGIIQIILAVGIWNKTI